MIAVLANREERPVVREFFELFKTPWQFLDESGAGEVILSSGAEPPPNHARVVIVYGHGGRRVRTGENMLVYEGRALPTYCGVTDVDDGAGAELVDRATGRAVVCRRRSGRQVRIRVGYDLFAEVRHLLTRGQSAVNAGEPTLDWHIAALRNWIVGGGVRLVEVPPSPVGHPFTVCLTHDVDHFGIRHHRWDHTAAGFLWRATAGSIFRWARGELRARDWARNMRAALSLPLVHAGWMRDFWADFERYIEIESGLPSTFFLIPKPNEAGQRTDGPAPRARAARYDIRSMARQIERLLEAGKEVGVHGIDAWRDGTKAIEELSRVSALTGQRHPGIRMHWLYSNMDTPVVLDEAGYNYDSTRGYNHTLGYHSGTAQPFKPLGARRLIELPLHAMDTAAFFPGYLGMSASQFGTAAARLMTDAERLGGVLTVNWHDRSVFPERLWERPYAEWISQARGRRAWFATASDAVEWFRRRRGIQFKVSPAMTGSIKVRSGTRPPGGIPGYRIRIHKAPWTPGARTPHDCWTDIPFAEDIRIEL